MDQFVTVTVPRCPEDEQEIVNLRHVKKICRDSDYVSTLVFTDGERLDVFTESLKQAVPRLFAQPLTDEQCAAVHREVEATLPAAKPKRFDDLPPPPTKLPEPQVGAGGERGAGGAWAGENLGG